MAGTRLLVQATFLVEFVLLICVAGYFGLCRNNDVLCTPLFGQGGRSLLVLSPQWHENGASNTMEKGSMPLRRYALHVPLVLEDGSEWSEYASAMDTVLAEKRLVKHPCLVGSIETEISFNGNLSSKARQVVNDANNTAEYRVAATTVKTWLTSRRNPHDDSRLDVLLYVPTASRMPLFMELKQQEPTSALTWEHSLLTIVDDAPSKKTESVSNAMAYVEPFLQDQCQLSADSPMWWRRLAHDTLERAKELVVVNHNVMSKSSLKVPITNEIAQRWKTSMKLVDEGIEYAKRGNHVAAVECFEESIAISQSLLRDSTLMEPIDMQNDHYMAVFFPLLFPLLLPFMAGLVREFKRYRKLKQGGGDSSSKTKVD